MGNFKISRVEEKLLKKISLLEDNLKKAAESSSKKENAESSAGFILPEKKPNENVEKEIKKVGNLLLSIENKIRDIERRFSDIQKQEKTEESEIFREIKPQIIKKQENIKEEKKLSSGGIFMKSFLEKYSKVSVDEKKVVSRLFKIQPGNWVKTDQLEIKETMERFLVPLLCRKFVLDGVPLIKMKDVGGKLKIVWGDSFVSRCLVVKNFFLNLFRF